MAKRVRGTGFRSTSRPGRRVPASSSGPSTRSAGATTPEAAAPSVAAAPIADPVAPAPVSRSTRGRVKVKPDSALALNATEEYAYIRQDLRRITAVAAGLVGSLIIIWFVLTTIDPLGLY